MMEKPTFLKRRMAASPFMVSVPFALAVHASTQSLPASNKAYQEDNTVISAFSSPTKSGVDFKLSGSGYLITGTVPRWDAGSCIIQIYRKRNTQTVEINPEAMFDHVLTLGEVIRRATVVRTIINDVCHGLPVAATKRA